MEKYGKTSNNQRSKNINFGSIQGSGAKKEAIKSEEKQHISQFGADSIYDVGAMTMQESTYSKPSSGFANRIGGGRQYDARSSGGFQSVFSASVNENKYIA